MFVLDKLTGLLPKKAQPYAKALYPAAAALAAAGVSWVQSGNLDVAELKTVVGGAVLALISYAVPNGD